MKKRLVVACLFVCSITQASLDWERTECLLVVHPSQVSAPAIFSFVNTGEEPATITGARVSCGCLSVKLAKRTFAPGERGELLVNFDLRNRTGKQRKTIFVKTGEGTGAKLYVECEIPTAYNPKPKTVVWGKGDDATTKTVLLRNPGTLPIKLLSITSSNKGLPVELKTVREGFEYEVIVSRKTSDANARSVVRIATEPPPGLVKSKTIKLYVYAP